MIPKIIKIKLDNNVFILNNFRELSNLAFPVDAIIELTPIKKIISHIQRDIKLSGINPIRVVIIVPPLRM